VSEDWRPPLGPVARVLAPVLRRPVMALDARLMRPRGVYALKAPPGTCGYVRGGRLCGKPAACTVGIDKTGLCAVHKREMDEAVVTVTELLTRKGTTR
jgi:hypothetical protein